MSRKENPRLDAANARLEEAENLIWALLDERLDDIDLKRLGQMIEDDAAVRSRYIECVQLHVDLQEHFGQQAAEKDAKPVVLPNLLPGLPGVQGIPNLTE